MLGLSSLAELARLGAGLAGAWWAARPFSRVNPLVVLLLLIKPPWLGVVAFSLALALSSSGWARRGVALVVGAFLGVLYAYGLPRQPGLLLVLVSLGTLGWLWAGGRLSLGGLARLGLAAAGLVLSWRLLGDAVVLKDPWLSLPGVLLAAALPEPFLAGSWGALAGPVPALLGLASALSLKAHRTWGQGVSGGLAPYLGASALAGRYAFAALGPGFGLGAGVLALVASLSRYPRVILAALPLTIPLFLKNPWLYLLFAPLSAALFLLPRLSAAFAAAWSFALAGWVYLMPYSARVPKKVLDALYGKRAYIQGKWELALAYLWEEEPLLAARAARRLGKNPVRLYARAGAYEELLSFLEATGTPEEAVAWGERALRKGAVGPRVFEGLAWGYLGLGRFADARRYAFKSWLLGNPDALAFLGDLTGSRELFVEALKEGSTLRRAYKLLARAHIYRGDTSRALKYLKWE